jgi:MFS family permease
MLAALAPVCALLLSVAVLQMGNGLQGTLLPVRASIEAFPTLAIGILGSSYFLGFTGGCILGPRAVRRVGHIRAFTAMVSIASTTALVHALMPNPVVWWLLRALTGFCFAALYMIVESWLNERSTNGTRGLVFSVYYIINLSALTVGQMTINFDHPGSFTLFSLASILVSVALVPVAMSTAPAPAPLCEARLRVRRLWQMSPVGFAGCFFVGLVNGSFWALGPVFAQERGMNISGVALFMSGTLIAGALGQWPLGRASDKMDRRKVISGACVAGALAGLAAAFLTGPGQGGIFLTSFLFGAFAFPLYALCVAHTNDFVAPQEYVEAASGLLLVYGLGAVIGPTVASGLMAELGPHALFAFTAFVHATLALFALQRMWMRTRPPEKERAEFSSMLAAPTVSPIDPAAASGGREQGSIPVSSASPASQQPA